MSEIFPKGAKELLKEVHVDGDGVSIMLAEPSRKLQNGAILVSNLKDLVAVLHEHSSKKISMNIHDGFVLDSIEGIDGNELPVTKFHTVRLHQSLEKPLKKLANISAVYVESFCSDLDLENVKALHVRASVHHGRFSFSQCILGRLTLRKTQGNLATLDISNSRILSLGLDKKFDVEELVLRGNSSIETRIERARLNEKEGSLLRQNGCLLSRVSLANLHDWANTNGDSRLAHIARSAELGIERAYSVGADWVFLSCWGLFSDYGLSAIKPLRWMLAASVLFTLLVFVTGASVGGGVDYVGWRTVLENVTSVDGRLYRSVVCSLEGILSPLSVFSVRRLIVPDQTWVAVVQVLYNYFCLSMVVLLGFSVRRRFKVS